MELWLLLGLLSYFFYAISTSIDKYLMSHKYGATKTDIVKMFFDGTILLVIGLAFFQLNFSLSLILWSLVLGFFYAFSGLLYFKALQIEDVETVVPNIQSLSLLLTFILSLIFFKETAHLSTWLGLILILIGIYTVLSKDHFRLPKMNHTLVLILGSVVLTTVYYLLTKKLLGDIKPISLAIAMYLSTSLILLIYRLIIKGRSFQSFLEFLPSSPKIALASLFGAVGTLSLYSALAVGDASKVYPLAGLEAVFVFILATLFLKEKFYWFRLIGTVIVVIGIFLVSM